MDADAINHTIKFNSFIIQVGTKANSAKPMAGILTLVNIEIFALLLI